MDPRKDPPPLLYGCLVVVIILAVAVAGFAVIFLWDVNVKH